MSRLPATKACAWCGELIAITMVSDRAPLEVLDDDRQPGPEQIADALAAPLPDEEDIETFSLNDGRWVMIHRECVVQVAFAVIREPQLLEKLRPKT